MRRRSRLRILVYTNPGAHGSLQSTHLLAAQSCTQQIQIPKPNLNSSYNR